MLSLLVRLAGALALVVSLLYPAVAQVQNIPPNTVLGRFGSGNPGPPQAIPFAAFSTFLNSALVSPGSSGHVGVYNSGGTTITDSGHGIGTSGGVLGLLNANKTDSGNNTFTGSNTFSAGNTFSGNNTFGGTNIFNGPEQFNGAASFFGNVGIQGDVNGQMTFTGAVSHNGGDVFNSATTFNGTAGFAGNVIMTSPLSVPNGGTGGQSFTSGAPIVGAGTGGLASGSVAGTSGVFATVNGTLTPGHCVQASASGGLQDSGFTSCGSSGSGVNLAGNNVWTGTGQWTGGSSNQPWCDPRAEGAAFNGSTDDTAAWAACVTALPNGGTIRTAGGFSTSCLKSGLTINGSGIGGIHIIGSGTLADVIISACGTNITPLTVENCAGCSVENLQIYGDGIGATHPALLVTNSSAILLRNLTVQYGSIPISISGASLGSNNCVLSNVRANFSYGAANLYLENADGCNVYDSGFDAQSPGLAPLPASLSGLPAAWQSGHAYGATAMTATICNSACSGSGTEMHVTALTGNLAVNEQVSGTGVTAGTQIACQLTGSGGSCTTFTGGTGYYQVDVASNITSGTSMTTFGDFVGVPSNAPTYYIQLMSPGTSLGSGTGPTLQSYGTNITDNTATWQLSSPVGMALIQCDSGCSENTFNNHDLTAAGGATYDMLFTDTLSTGGPTNNVITGITLGGTPFTTMLYAQVGQRLSITNIHTNNPAISSEAALVFGASWGGYARIVGSGYANSTTGNGTGSFINFGGGTNNVVEGNTIIGGNGVAVSNGTSNVTIEGNEYANPGTCLNISGAASDYIDFSHNDCQGGSISNSSTATHNVIRDNRGINPVGVTSATWATGSTSNYTAGPTPETHYLTGGNVSSVKVGTQQVCSATPCFVDLGPNEVLNLTYSGAPTDVKSVH